MRTFSKLSIALVLLSSSALAKEAPLGMNEFNKTCPAPALCEKLGSSQADCSQGKKNSCKEFVDTYRKLMPEYDCQRPSDSSGGKKSIVPAVWLCGNGEKALSFLSSMKSIEAKRLFGSPELRMTLDGALAEDYGLKSVSVEKSLKSSN